jgi:hypothetical protein
MRRSTACTCEHENEECCEKVANVYLGGRFSLETKAFKNARESQALGGYDAALLINY